MPAKQPSPQTAAFYASHYPFRMAQLYLGSYESPPVDAAQSGVNEHPLAAYFGWDPLLIQGARLVNEVSRQRDRSKDVVWRLTLTGASQVLEAFQEMRLDRGSAEGHAARATVGAPRPAPMWGAEARAEVDAELAKKAEADIFGRLLWPQRHLDAGSVASAVVHTAMQSSADVAFLDAVAGALHNAEGGLTTRPGVRGHSETEGQALALGMYSAVKAVSAHLVKKPPPLTDELRKTVALFPQLALAQQRRDAAHRARHQRRHR